MEPASYTDIIRQIFHQGQPLVRSKGDVLLGNESDADGVYLLSSGFVKAYSISDDGSENLHLVFGKHEIFPLVWAYLGLQQTGLFYESISQSALWRISHDQFYQLVANDLRACYAMSMQLARQFQIFIDRVDNLEYKHAGERLAYRLLFLAGRFGSKQDDGTITIYAPITHEIIGNSINLARESVSRQLEILEKEGTVAVYRHRITITNVSALAAKLNRPVSYKNWGLEQQAVGSRTSATN